jgi:hypothetical protein
MSRCRVCGRTPRNPTITPAILNLKLPTQEGKMLRLSLLIIGVLIALPVLHNVAAAEPMGYVVLGPPDDPELNNYLSARYDYLLQTNMRFRHFRMWKECHIINWIPLHDDCIASFDEYEPVIR